MTVPSSASPAPPGARRYRYDDLLMAAFVTVLLCSNLIGPGKSCSIALPFALPLLGSTLVFGAGNIFFPISYIFGDVLTEVYGYAKARKVIWAGFISMAFATLMGWAIIHLPRNPGEPYSERLQPALELCFGNTWRIVLASMVAFWAGDFANSYVLARMKILTRGRWLWTRTIGSTCVGQGLDSLLFYPVALASWHPLLKGLGVTSPSVLAAFDGWNSSTVLQTVMFNWAFKVAVEVVMTPLTYLVVGWLKRAEREDFFDVATDFSPFSLHEDPRSN